MRVVVSLAVAAVVATACGSAAGPGEVVVYTSVDQPVSQSVLEDFEETTGIRVRAVYDTEATKTTGLVSRLRAERDRPQADVFWSSEIVLTMSLTEDVLAPYASPVAEDLPAGFVDRDDKWAAFGYRARILLVNTDLVDEDERPASIFDLLDGTIPADEVAIANPLFGTTATHVAALYSALGAEEARRYLTDLADAGVRVVDGNSVVRDLVVAGDVRYGLTDTDDAAIAVAEGEPVEIVFPDQDDLGTLLIPNTVGLVAGGPNPDNGRRLIDHLLGREVEDRLVEAGFLHGSLREIGDETVRPMVVDWPDVAAHVETAAAETQSLLLR